MEESQIVLSIINGLKIIQKPGSADLIDIKAKMIELVDKLPTLFSSEQLLGIPIKQHTLEFNGYISFPQKYLLVLGAITKVLGTQLYMKETLDSFLLSPRQTIIIIGLQTDVALMNHLAKYIWEMWDRIYQSIRINRPKGIHPRVWKDQFNKTFFMPFYEVFMLVNKHHGRTQFPNLEKRDNKVFDFLINNYIFENNNQRINPLLDGAFDITKYQVKDGKYTQHQLLWA